MSSPIAAALRAIGARFNIPRDASRHLPRPLIQSTGDMTIEAFARALAAVTNPVHAFRLLILGQGDPGYVAKLKKRAAALHVSTA